MKSIGNVGNYDKPELELNLSSVVTDGILF